MKKEHHRIGFIGLGRMGANMARRLIDQGYSLTAVHDRKPSLTRDLAAEIGCLAASTPAQVAECSTTVITVVTDDQAMNAIFAEQRADSLLRHAQGRLFINCATVSPVIHVDIEARVGRHGGHSLEACMASSMPQARAGTLFLICAGRPEIYQGAQPLLQSLSSSLRYIGKAGEAAKVKALVNMVMNINTAGLAEGLGLGAALGLDLGMLQEVFAQTGAASRVLETDGVDMIHRDHECYFSAAHAAKDSHIALTLAKEQGVSLPLAKATLQQYRLLVELGRGTLDKSAVAELTFPGRH